MVFLLSVLAGTFADLALPLLVSVRCFWADFLLLRWDSLAGVADAGLAGTVAGEAMVQSSMAGFAAGVIVGFLDRGEMMCCSGWAHCS